MKLKKTKENLNQITSLINANLQTKIDFKKDKNFLTRYQHSTGYGIFQGHQLTDYLMVNLFNSRVFKQRTKMAGIGYLSSLPNEKRKKTLSLFEEVFHDLHADKIPYVDLSPLAKITYHRFGFEDAVYQKTYYLKAEDLKHFKMPKQGKVKAGVWKDLVIQNGAAQLYEVPLHTTDERNTMNRSFWWWNLLNSYYSGRKLAVYFGRVGLPQAYMFYRIYNQTCHIEELYSINAQAICGLLAYLYQNLQKNLKYQIIMPEESKLENLFSNEKDLKIQVKPFMMSRIIDFNAILHDVKVTSHGNYLIEVTKDDFCPWNEGKWLIKRSASAKQAAVKKVQTDKAADYKGTINAWTKILLGNLTIDGAILLGKIKGDRHNNLAFDKGTVSFFDAL